MRNIGFEVLEHWIRIAPRFTQTRGACRLVPRAVSKPARPYSSGRIAHDLVSLDRAGLTLPLVCVSVTGVDGAERIGSGSCSTALLIGGKLAVAGITPLPALQTVFVVLRQNGLSAGQQGHQ